MPHSIRTSYTHTIFASYLGCATQAVVNNFAPLLFLTFQTQMGLTLEQITLLTTLNFSVQLLVDFLSVKAADKIGYRPCVVAAHVFSAAGLAALAVLPQLLGNAYLGLMLAVVLYAVGGGLILAGILWSLYRRGEEIVFEAEQVVVKTRFSREMYPYEGMNFLLRRSWTVTFHRGLTAGGGLAGVAIQLRRGKRAEVTVPAARFDGRAQREAIDFLSQLPNPKRYL